MRDIHGVTEECTYFKKGKCKYPDRVCWKKHTRNSPSTSITSAPVTERVAPEHSVECYICKNKFKTKRDLMLHRLEKHLEKVMPCRNGENCQFTNCWYKHPNKQNVNKPNEEESNNKGFREDIQNTENFQKAPIGQKPPENMTV